MFVFLSILTLKFKYIISVYSFIIKIYNLLYIDLTQFIYLSFNKIDYNLFIYI